MMNSVTVRAPRCSVSAKFHILPSVSFGRPALSNITLACSPGRIPSSAPDFSKREAYWATLSGVRVGTLLIRFPLVCGWIALGGGGPAGGKIPPGRPPSNFGIGAGLSASSGVGSRPAWECPISRKTMPKLAGVRKPMFSLSAICQIYSASPLAS